MPLDDSHRFNCENLVQLKIRVNHSFTNIVRSDPMEEVEIPRFKVIFLGDAGVGKTSIIRRQTMGTFDFKMAPTIGTGNIISEVEVDKRTVQLCIWDTAGQEQYHSIVPLYLRNVHVVVLIASLVDHVSITHLSKWKSLVETHDRDAQIVVAVNKADLQDGAPMSIDEVRNQLFDDFPVINFVSARTNSAIDELFFEIAKKAMRRSFDKQDTGLASAKPTTTETGCSC